MTPESSLEALLGQFVTIGSPTPMTARCSAGTPRGPAPLDVTVEWAELTDLAGG